MFDSIPFTIMYKRILLPSFLALALLVVSCAKKTDSTTSDSSHTSGSNATSSTASVTIPPITDQSILAELEAFDSNAINQARYVKYHTRNKNVLAFANMMWTDHLKFIKSGQTITKKDNIEPASPALAKDKADMATNMAAVLSADSAIDHVYLSHAVDDINKQVGDLQAWQLSAQNPYLKAKIANDLPIMQSHLNQARSLLAPMKSK
jgi:predicted outer membrane protein